MQESKLSQSEECGNKLKVNSNQIRQGAWIISIVTLFLFSCSTKKDMLKPADPVEFSQEFLLSVKLEDPYDMYLDTLRRLDVNTLAKDLDLDNKRKTFWINIYNALVQIKLKESNYNYGDQFKFFNTRNIEFGGDSLSLNIIENAILRRQFDASYPEFTKELALEQPDYRIHFALNCGASACPPIAFYSADDLDKQLELSEAVFIQNDTKFDSVQNIVFISELFRWYEEDFVDSGGILQLLIKHQMIGKTTNPEIQYRPYDWNIRGGNYR